MSAERRLRKALVVTAAATGLAVAGLLGYETIRPKQQNPDNTPPPGGIVKPSASPIPTPSITIPPSLEALPSPTPQETIPIESFEPSTPAPTESISVLEQRLNDWVDGKIKVPDSKRFKIHGKPAILNIIDNKPQPWETWYPTFQGYFLGFQFVDNHLILYIGQQDSKGKNYFIPTNIGELNKGYIQAVFEDPNRSVFPTGTADVKLIPNEQFQKIMTRKFKDETGVFILFPYVPSVVDPTVNAQEARDQVEIVRQFSNWSIAVAKDKSYTDSALFRKYPLVKNLINKRVTSFNSNEMPYGLEWWLPTNDIRK